MREIIENKKITTTNKTMIWYIVVNICNSKRDQYIEYSLIGNSQSKILSIRYYKLNNIKFKKYKKEVDVKNV